MAMQASPALILHLVIRAKESLGSLWTEPLRDGVTLGDRAGQMSLMTSALVWVVPSVESERRIQEQVVYLGGDSGNPVWEQGVREGMEITIWGMLSIL